MSNQEIYSSEKKWKLSREKFLKTIVLSGLALQMPWLTGCEDSETIDFDTSPLSREDYRTLIALQDILFPSDGNGPGAEDVNAGPYFLWVMNDPIYDHEIQDALRDDQSRFEQACLAQYSYRFHELDRSDQETFVKKMVDEDSTVRKWCSRLLTLIFEALLLDPMYGGNPEKIGWKWFDHNPGQPRPKVATKYPEILQKHEV